MEFNVDLFLNSAFMLFVVLGLGSLAGYFCEKVGIVNIAIDGQMIFGALIFSIFGMLFSNLLGDLSGAFVLVPIIISALISVLLSWIFGWLTIKLKADHVVAGTAINLVVAGIATFITVPLGTAISGGVYPKLKITFSPDWILADNLYGETIMILAIAVIIIVAAILVMSKTRFGLRMKAIGDNPNAVNAQGIDVNKYKWLGVMISGVFAALAGSIFILGGPKMYAQSSYFEGNVAGLGFLCIAIVVSGAWKIPFMGISALVFAALMSGANIANNISADPEIKKVVGEYIKYAVKTIPFVVSLIVLIIFSRKGYAPKELGKHFDKALR